MSKAALQQEPELPVSIAALFIAFLTVSLCGFGGGLVWAHRIAVEQRRWTSEQEFADIVSLCQFMPGPNMVGIAVCVGAKLRGCNGAAAALCGFIAVPWRIGFTLGAPPDQARRLATAASVGQDTAAGHHAAAMTRRSARQ